jgi:Domain of unknown function (DUF4249)
MKNIFKILTVSTLALASCQKVDFDKTNLNKPTVDGIVYAGRNPKIHLSLPIGYGDDAATQVNVDDAQVTITISGIKYALVSKGNGDYVNDKVILKAGQELDLTIVYAGNTLTSSTVVPAKPKNLKASDSQIQIVAQTGGGGGPFGGGGLNQATAALTWDNDVQDFYVLLTKNTETSPEQITFQGPNGMGGGGNPDRGVPPTERLSQPTQTNTQSINQRQFSYYGSYQFILFKVNAEYNNLYNSRGQSSLNLTNPPTNITNGFGIFTAMNADTVEIKVIK